MKRALSLLACLIGLVALPAQARLFESLEECIARYGEPTKIIEEEQTAHFKKGGFLIAATFRDGICHRLLFQKAIKNGEFRSAEITKNEIATLLAANRIDSTKRWKLHEDGINQGYLLGEDDTDFAAGAIYGTIDHRLFLMTREETEFQHEQNTEKAERNLKGF